MYNSTFINLSYLMKYVFLLAILSTNDWSIPVLSLKNITLMILKAQRQIYEQEIL